MCERFQENLEVLYISGGKSCLTIVDKFLYHPHLKHNFTVVTYNAISTKF